MLIDRYSGKLIDENAHIRQSVIDIITTRIGERVMRREYGTILLDVIDAPMNEILVMQLMSSIFMALNEYEPRIEVASCFIDSAEVDGTLEIVVEGRVKTSGALFSLTENLHSWRENRGLGDISLGDISMGDIGGNLNA